MHILTLENVIHHISSIYAKDVPGQTINIIQLSCRVGDYGENVEELALDFQDALSLKTSPLKIHTLLVVRAESFLYK